MESKRIVEGYLKKKDWRVHENSNAAYSFGALNKYITTAVSKDYWLDEVYPERIKEAYESGAIHIHDLGGITLYCCGYSLSTIIREGVHGVSNIPTSAPAKHFASILNQLSNLVTVFQNEIMGAVAFSSVDTLLAPFIKEDSLTYEEVKQALQNFIFSINSNSRGGAEPAFSNITLDITPPKDLLTANVEVGGGFLDYTYKECQPEMDMFNRAFCELMVEGDSVGKPFAYPIPTYNIHERFNWDNPNDDLMWEMAGKYGYPYFANFLNSDMEPEDARSMCCRLRLDKRELEKRGGGLFGAGDSTGSIGVVTLNLPRYAYLSSSVTDFFALLDINLELAKESLEIKREFLQEHVLEAGLIPAYQTYVGTLKNHFSTIGVIGLNEMCMNLNGCDILTDSCKQFCVDVLDYIRERLADFQEETGNMYNLEATPAESTAYRLASKDKRQFPTIFTQGTEEAPYYTNSCHMPVDRVESIRHLFDHQEDLQVMFTGGTVVHVYLDGAISGPIAKHIVKTVCHKYKVPYVSLSPVNRYCKEHGYVAEHVEECPKCGETLEMFQRITGYMRNVDSFNIGKKAEFKDRNQLFVEDGLVSVSGLN